MNNYDYNDNTAYRLIIFFIAVILFGLALVLVGFIGSFFYTYKQVIFYIFAVVFSSAAVFIMYCVCETVQIRFERKRLENEHYRQQLLSVESSNAIFNATVRQLDNGQVFLTEQKTADGMVKFSALSRKKIVETSLALSEPEASTETKNTLLKDLEHCQRVLLVGGQNSGKTTLLKHIAKQRAITGSILVLDSHNAAGKWNSNYTIFGHGRDYKAIENELQNLVNLMDVRYKELASGKVGERQHPLITIISDEWTTVSKNITDLDKYLLPLLTESRKVGIDLILATHSQTAESLGLKGKADLKTAFDVILTLKNRNGQRFVVMDNGEELVNYHHTGHYQNDFYIPVQPELKTNSEVNLDKDFSNKLTEIMSEDLTFDLKVIDAYYALKEAGNFSWNNLSKSVYDGKVNGRYVANLKAILARHNILTSQ